MTFLSAGELANMRLDANMLLVDSGVITRPSDVSDGQGGGNRTWATIGTVPARLEPYRRSTPETEEGQGEHPEARKVWNVLTPALTDLRVIDRVAINGLVLEVAGVKSPRSEEVLCRAEVVELVA